MKTRHEVVLNSGECCGGALNLCGITKRFNEIKRQSDSNWVNVTDADILCTDLFRHEVTEYELRDARFRPIKRHDPALVQAVRDVGDDTDFYVTTIESDRYHIFRDGRDEYIVTPESLTENDSWITIYNHDKSPRLIAVHDTETLFCEDGYPWYHHNIQEDLREMKGVTDYTSFWYFGQKVENDERVLYPHDHELIQLLIKYPLPGWRFEVVCGDPIRYVVIDGEIFTPKTLNWVQIV